MRGLLHLERVRCDGRRPPAPARGAAGGARRHQPEGRVPPVRAVRLLHGAGRRQGDDRLLARPRPGGGQERDHARGRRPSTSASATPRLRRHRRPAVRVLHAGHRDAHQGPGRQGRAGAHPRQGRPPPRRPPVPVHRLPLDPRRHRDPGGRATRWRSLAAARPGKATARLGRRQPQREVPGRRAGLGDKRLRRRPAGAGDAARGGRAGRARPGRRAGHRHVRGRGLRRCRAGAHRRRRAGRAAGGPHPPRLAGVHPRGRAHVLHGRRPRPGGGRGPGHGPAAAQLVDVDYHPWPRSPTPARPRQRRGRRVGPRRQPAVAQRLHPGRRRCRPGGSAHTVHEVFQTQRVEHAFLEPESTLAVPHEDGRSRCSRAARGCGTTAARSPTCSPSPRTASSSTWSPTAGRSAARRTSPTSARPRWRPACWAGRSSARQPRGVAAPPRQAPPVRIEAWAGLRRRGQPDRAQEPHRRRLRPLRLGRHEGARAGAGHASGPYVWPAIDVEALAVRTNNPVCGAFRGFGANQAQFASRGPDRPAGRRRRRVPLGDAARNAVTPGRRGSPARSWTTAAWAPSTASRRSSPPTRRRWPPARPSASASASRTPGLGNGFIEVAKAVVRFEDDGTVEVRHCWTEMGQGVHTVALQVAVEELGVAPDASGWWSTRPASWAPARPPAAGHAHGRRVGARPPAGRPRRRLPPGRRLRGRAPRRLDPGARHGREPDHPLGLRLRRPAGGDGPRDRRHRAGGRRPRRRPGGQPAAVRGPGGGVRPHGPRLRPVRGLPHRRQGRRPST